MAGLGLFLIFVVASFGVAGARADVLDIQANGTVTVYSGPAMWSRGTVRPIEDSALPYAYNSSRRPSLPQLSTVLDKAAKRYHISGRFLAAVAWRESRWNVNARSTKGAQGLMQLMPATAQALGVRPTDPASNAAGGAAYLGELMRRFNGDLISALAAYNAGPAAVERYHGIPPYPETKKYVSAILDNLADVSLRGPGTGASP